MFNNLPLFIGGGGASSVLEDITHADLLIKMDNAQLVQGKFYRITDFVTIYDQPDFDEEGSEKAVVETITSLLSEPLICIAIASTDIHRHVISELFPDDKIQYDPYFTQTEKMGAPAKGRIIMRTDQSGNTSNYDHTSVVFKRYETQLGNGVYESYKDTGFGFATFGTFLGASRNNTVLHIQTGEIVNFLLPNNVFGEGSNNRVEGFIKNNTVGENWQNNRIVGEFRNNLIYANFRANTIKGSFLFNMVGDDFYANSIVDYFSNSLIGKNFMNNTITASFVGCQVSDNFQYNKVDSQFVNYDFTTALQVYLDTNCHLLKDEVLGNILTYFLNGAMIITDPNS